MSGSKASAFHLASDPKPPERRAGTPLALPQSSRAQDRAQTTGIRTDEPSAGAPSINSITSTTSTRGFHLQAMPASEALPMGSESSEERGGRQENSLSNTLTFATQGSYIHIHRSRDPSSPSDCDAAAMSLHASAGGQQELPGSSVIRPTQPLEGALWSQRGPTHSASGRGSLVPALTDPLSLWKGLSGPSVDRPTQPLEGALWSQRGPTHSASGRAPRAPLWNNDFLLFSYRFPF
ncbi:unnamed protein product [Gadus morhua 'NCC']